MSLGTLALCLCGDVYLVVPGVCIIISGVALGAIQLQCCPAVFRRTREYPNLLSRRTKSSSLLGRKTKLGASQLKRLSGFLTRVPWLREDRPGAARIASARIACELTIDAG